MQSMCDLLLSPRVRTFIVVEKLSLSALNTEILCNVEIYMIVFLHIS